MQAAVWSDSLYGRYSTDNKAKGFDEGPEGFDEGENEALWQCGQGLLSA